MSSDGSWDSSSEAESEQEGIEEEKESPEANVHVPESQVQVPAKTGQKKRSAGKGSSFSCIPYHEVCDIQGAARDAMAGELQWSFRNSRAHERWPQRAPKALHNALDATPSVPENFSDVFGSTYPAEVPQRADDDTSGFKWPQDFEEAPAVPQKFTKERDISQLARTEVLNTFAGEKWIAERTMSAVKCCHTPSVEQTRALKEHLTTTAFLPRLILDPKEAKQSTKQKKKLPRWHADMTPADLRNLVEKRVQPAHAELKSLYSTCLPIAASAAARTQQPTPENHPEDHQGDATDSDVMAALLAGERELNSMHLMAADVVDPAADAHVEAVHAGIAEAAVNAGASILNNALSQVRYPYKLGRNHKLAWTRSKALLHKIRSSPFRVENDPMMAAAHARSHLLAPGHAPFAHSSPLNSMADSLPSPHGAATGNNVQDPACPPQKDCHLQLVQTTMAAAMPAKLKKVEVTWGQTDTADAHSLGDLHNGCNSQGRTNAVETPNQLVQENIGSAGDGHPLHVMAAQLAKAWRTTAEAGGSAGAGEWPGLGGYGGSAQQRTNATQTSASTVPVEKPKIRAKQSTSAPIISQPMMQPLPAATVCHLLDNEAQFRVVVEFEKMSPNDSTAQAPAPRCVDDGVEKNASTRSQGADKAAMEEPGGIKDDAQQQHGKICDNQEQQQQQIDSAQEQRWFAAEIPLTKQLASVFLRWPADSGPPTWLSNHGTNLSRLYLKRCSRSIRPAHLLQRWATSILSTCTPVSEAPTTGDSITPVDSTTPAPVHKPLHEAASSQQQQSNAPLAFLYPIADDAGLVSSMWGRPELQGMFVAQHWSTPRNFALACNSESAAQNLCRLQVPTPSHQTSNERSPVWSLLSAELPAYGNYNNAARAFRATDSAAELSPHPLVSPVLDEFSALRPTRAADAATTSLQATQAGPSAAVGAATDIAASNEQAAQQPWLVAAGYLGRSLAEMLSSRQGLAQDGDCRSVKCNQDEVLDLLERKVIVARTDHVLKLDGKKYSVPELAAVQRKRVEACSDDSSLQQPHDSASDRNTETDVNPTIDRKRKPKDSTDLFLQQHTEVMGLPLQEVAKMHTTKQQKICKNGAAVQKALSTVVRIEDEAELNLGGVAADVTMMFRGAQACGLPASILQRAAARFKKIMAAQSTNNQ